MAEACGAGVVYPPNKNPWISNYLIKTEADLDRLHVPDFMATRSTRVMIEGTRRLAERATVPVAAFMSGPLTFSLQLMPYNDLIKRGFRAFRMEEGGREGVPARGFDPKDKETLLVPPIRAG